MPSSVVKTSQSAPNPRSDPLWLQRARDNPHARIVHQAAHDGPGSRSIGERLDHQLEVFCGPGPTVTTMQSDSSSLPSDTSDLEPFIGPEPTMDTMQANLSTLPSNMSDLIDEESAFRAEMNVSPTPAPIVRKAAKTARPNGLHAGVEEPKVEAGPSSQRANGRGRMREGAHGDHEVTRSVDDVAEKHDVGDTQGLLVESGAASSRSDQVKGKGKKREDAHVDQKVPSLAVAMAEKRDDEDLATVYRRWARTLRRYLASGGLLN